jgi:N4-acetylcytidine amidohydrolase
MTLLKTLTFFERFEADILAGRKMITLRDAAESHVQAGQVLPLLTLESARHFCDARILFVSPVTLGELNERHAAQENMSLEELKALIQQIYPGLEQLFEIHFEVIRR